MTNAGKVYKKRERMCWVCHALFLGNAKAKYCSEKCRKRAYRARKSPPQQSVSGNASRP